MPTGGKVWVVKKIIDWLVLNMSLGRNFNLFFPLSQSLAFLSVPKLHPRLLDTFRGTGPLAPTNC